MKVASQQLNMTIWICANESCEVTVMKVVRLWSTAKTAIRPHERGIPIPIPIWAGSQSQIPVRAHNRATARQFLSRRDAAGFLIQTIFSYKAQSKKLVSQSVTNPLPGERITLVSRLDKKKAETLTLLCQQSKPRKYYHHTKVVSVEGNWPILK